MNRYPGVVKFPRDLILIAVLSLAVGAAQHSRPWVMELPCKGAPESCVSAKVVWPDRLTIGVSGGNSDVYSDYTQYAAGALAVLAPIAIGGWSAALEVIPFAVAALANATTNEVVRLIVQRPRPYVYADPKSLGHEVTSYTSFYSGHTSFATVAAVHLAFALRRRGVRPVTLWGVGLLGAFLVFLTALFRVLSGYHFISDVLVGALVGCLICYSVSGRR